MHLWGLPWSSRWYFCSHGPSTGPREPNPPPGLTNDAKLNDSVWELYCPNEMPDMDIILFHGLQLDEYEDAFWKTWLSRNNNEIVWPKDWLSRKFPKARILSVSYNSSAARSEGQLDEYTLGENLVSNILLDSNYDIGQHCPVFLVGHCLGGIVIKQLILSAVRMKSSMSDDDRRSTKISSFLENFKGAFFYGTPHSGSDEIQKFINSQLQTTIQLSNYPLLRLLKTLATETARINNEFRQQRTKWNARTFGFAESRPTTFPGYRGVIIPEASIRHDVDMLYTSDADHFTVCKARDMRDNVIGNLAQFILDTPNQTITHVAIQANSYMIT